MDSIYENNFMESRGVLPRSSASLLREEDQSLYEEDAERNVEQAGRNLRMRSMLRNRRQTKEVNQVAEAPQTDFEEFMSVGTATNKPDIDENAPPWLEVRPHLDNVVLRLHEEMIDFTNFMKFSPEEVQARRDWVKTIGAVCKKLWPECELRIFGSFFTGLSLPNGDVDVTVLNVPCKAGTAMKILADTMLESGEISWLEIIESAKVPVMKIRSQSHGLRADVVFNMIDGLETSKFIRARIKEFPQMRPLLVFLKYFLIQRGLNDTFTGGMGSYLLCNVVVHFMQRHPSLKDPKLYAATSLGHLIFDFFKYYGRDFRYDVGISVLNGGYTFRKEDRGWFGKGKGKGDSKGKSSVHLCVESPLGDTPVDLGGPCFRIHMLRNLFNHAFNCLCHLFVSRQFTPEGSLLCPLLLDPAHGVITNRHALMTEQPQALVSKRRNEDGLASEAGGENEPLSKRSKSNMSLASPSP